MSMMPTNVYIRWDRTRKTYYTSNSKRARPDSENSEIWDLPLEEQRDKWAEHTRAVNQKRKKYEDAAGLDWQALKEIRELYPRPEWRNYRDIDEQLLYYRNPSTSQGFDVYGLNDEILAGWRDPNYKYPKEFS